MELWEKPRYGLGKILDAEGDFKGFVYHGHHCTIERNGVNGELCGYIQLLDDEINEEFSRTYYNVELSRLPHGGVTYAKMVGTPRGNLEGPVIGFEASHSGDLSPYVTKGVNPRPIREGWTYKTMGYMQLEIRKTVEALEQLASWKR